MGYFTGKEIGGWPHLQRRINALQRLERYKYTSASLVTGTAGQSGVFIAASADYVYTAERQTTSSTERWIRQYSHAGTLINEFNCHQVENPNWPTYSGDDDDGGYMIQILGLDYDHTNDLLYVAGLGTGVGVIDGANRNNQRVHAFEPDLTWSHKMGQFPVSTPGVVTIDGDIKRLSGGVCNDGAHLYIVDRNNYSGGSAVDGYLHKFTSGGTYVTRYTWQYEQVAYDLENDEIAAQTYFASGSAPADVFHMFSPAASEDRSFGGTSSYTVCPEEEAQFPSTIYKFEFRAGELYVNDGTRLQVVNPEAGLYVRRGVPGIAGGITAPPGTDHVFNANASTVVAPAARVYKLTYTQDVGSESTWHKWIDADNEDGYSKVSLGTPDGGVSVPALDAYEGAGVRIDVGVLLACRNAIESLAAKFRKQGSCNQMNWTDAHADNLYKLAVDRTLYGCIGATGYDWVQGAADIADLVNTPLYDIQIGEIHECIKYLEGCNLWDS